MPWAGALRWLGRYGIEPGAIGVLLFFLVSGFVIPFSLERVDRRGFVVRRFFRLYPTLWVCLLVTLAVLAVQARALGAVVPYGRRAAGANGLLLAVVAGAAAWRGWLLSRAVAVVAAALAVVCVVTRGAALASPLSWLGFNATYVVFILIGVVFHCVYRGLRGVPAGVGSALGLFGLYLLALHDGPARPVASIYVPSAVVALVVFGGLYVAREGLPYSAWLDRLSNISYPLYLLHGINGYVITRAIFLVTGNYYVAVSTAVLASLSVAVAVHHLVETPTNNFGRRLSRRLCSGADAAVLAPLACSVSPSPRPS